MTLVDWREWQIAFCCVARHAARVDRVRSKGLLEGKSSDFFRNKGERVPALAVLRVRRLWREKRRYGDLSSRRGDIRDLLGDRAEI